METIPPNADREVKLDHHILDNLELLLEYYKVQQADYELRHRAIWTEVQHYTWVLSVLLGAGPIAAVGQPSLSPLQLGFLIFLPLIGVMVAILAFFIMRKDFFYFSSADARLLFLEKKLGVLSEDDYIDARLQRAQRPDFTVRSDLEEQVPIRLVDVFKPRIRALILATFLVYAIAGVLEIAYFSYLFFL
ncbi:MAG: hypothetical protein JXC32_21630 [Anaerolineae bacterium]|nr:hypothetical protein [Anaerolineae bacterium]